MLGLFKSAKPAVSSSEPLLSGERFDSTLRPICFGLPLKVKDTVAKNVGSENFKKYEYLLYIGAQLSRLVYCDTGIIWYVIEKSLGMSNDVVNKVITAYDTKFIAQKRQPSNAPGSEVAPATQLTKEAKRPMESYSLQISKSPNDKYATYISTPHDLTCLVLNASKIRANTNSILESKDVFVTFKGSSTLSNLQHDLLSQFTATDLGALLETVNVTVGMNQGKNLVTGAFIRPILNAWNTLMLALEEHIKTDDTRLFLCGHSLGGAYCTLFAFILAEGKVSKTIPIMTKVKSIHILSYGSPTLLSDTARNTFNRHLESGLVTLDRVVSQKVAARTSAMTIIQGLALGAGPNDIIPSIPAGFAHPGFRPLATEFRPEANGRPYSMDNIRKFYGVTSNTRYRDPTTWPFTEDIGLGDWKNSGELNNLVMKITGVNPPPNKDPAEEAKEQGSTPQTGGFGEQKGIYSVATKNHIPDFVSVAGSNYAAGFAHAEYLGMFFMGGFRLPGMKNPGFGNRTAYFNLTPTGVNLSYVNFIENKAVASIKQTPLPPGESDSDVAKGGYRKLSKTRKIKKVKATKKMKKTSKLRR